jgi:hypothetical protein
VTGSIKRGSLRSVLPAEGPGLEGGSALRGTGVKKLGIRSPPSRREHVAGAGKFWILGPE